MRAFITGVDGFAGSHLADHLLDKADIEVWGCGLTPTLPEYVSPAVRYSQLDLREPEPTTALLTEAQPNQIFHLAGQAFVPASWQAPWATFEANVLATLNVLETVRLQELSTRILIVSSVEVYGSVAAQDLPVAEGHSFRANSPYSVSKVAQDLLGLSYAVSHGIETVRARPLNHIGPRQNNRFVAAAFAKQIARIEAGQQAPTLSVGDLTTQRDFTDVRDIVRAYSLLMERGEAGGAYNIASGILRSIEELLDALLNLATVPISVEADPDLKRTADTPPLTVNMNKLQRATNWRPEIPFEQTLLDLLNYERERVQLSEQEAAL